MLWTDVTVGMASWRSVHSARLGEASRQEGWEVKQNGGTVSLRVDFDSKDGGSHWRGKANRLPFYFSPFSLLSLGSCCVAYVSLEFNT